ncbi:CRISPR system precrRNA processing endoribonuclease RAMP protein Cas6 [Myxococcota bacterium]|nr:CRISPR system precrRNA processing endoribonuclease RAMP protein Cas6 [Myxococcota bacterium]
MSGLLDLTGLSYSRARFTLTPTAPTRLPPYLGSTLRGALGHALREIVGDPARDDIERALLASSCPYLSVFGEPRLEANGQERSRPFVLRPPPIQSEAWTARRPLRFELVLLGQAQSALPWIIAATRLMAGRGLGVSRAPFEMTDARASATGEALYIEGEAARLAPCEVLDDRPIEATALTLDLVGPAQLRPGEVEPLPEFERVARWGLRRLTPILRDHCGVTLEEQGYAALLEAAACVERTGGVLRPATLDRYSNRSGQKQRYRVYQGQLSYAGAALGEMAPLLRAIELLNIGKGASMGLGRVDARLS